MPRTICPQVSGIYQNNEAPTDTAYGYLWIPAHHPNSEYWAMDAYECTHAGDVNPAKTIPEPHLASDFGNVVSF